MLVREHWWSIPRGFDMVGIRLHDLYPDSRYRLAFFYFPSSIFRFFSLFPFTIDNYRFSCNNSLLLSASYSHWRLHIIPCLIFIQYSSMSDPWARAKHDASCASYRNASCKTTVKTDCDKERRSVCSICLWSSFSFHLCSDANTQNSSFLCPSFSFLGFISSSWLISNLHSILLVLLGNDVVGFQIYRSLDV